MVRDYVLCRKGHTIMPNDPNFDWKIIITLSNGQAFREYFSTEQEADTRINQLKGQNWLEFGRISINPNQIVTISKRDIRET